MVIDPANIDINVHPTKTEIKFEDERLIYNYIRVTLKHSLGQYSLTPMLDFSIDHNFAYKFSGDSATTPSRIENKAGKNMYSIENEARFIPKKKSISGWEEIYQSIRQPQLSDDQLPVEVKALESEAFQLRTDEFQPLKSASVKEPYQLHNTYIIHQVKSGMMIIDQNPAHERILYEQYLEILHNGEYSSQKELFPRTVELNPSESNILKAILPNVNALGFEMEEFGNHTFIIHGTPSGLENGVDIGTHNYNELVSVIRNANGQVYIYVFEDVVTGCTTTVTANPLAPCSTDCEVVFILPSASYIPQLTYVVATQVSPCRFMNHHNLLLFVMVQFHPAVSIFGITCARSG